MQNHHSLIYREEEREMFPTLKVGDNDMSLGSCLIQVDRCSVLDAFRGLRLREGCSRVLSANRQSAEKRTCEYYPRGDCTTRMHLSAVQ